MSVGTAKALGHTVTAGSKRQKKGGEAEEKRAEAEGTKKVRVAAERQEKAAEKRVAAATKRATADAAPLAAAAKRQKMEAEAEEKRAEAAAKRAEKARLAAERKAQAAERKEKAAERKEKAAEKRVAAAAKRATADAAKARRQEGRESKRQAKAQAAKAADEERVARAAAKAAREREKAARAEAAEEARRARQLPATSAEGGATSTAAKLYEKLARPTALALVKEDATNRPTLAPLLAVTATPTALAWCEELRNVFVGAYATASEYPKTQADEANLALRMLCFGSSVRAAMRRGFVAALHPEGVPAGLKVVVYELLRGMYETFKLALSTVAPPAPPPAVVEVDVEAGDVVTFVASWALSRELVKAVEAVCGRGGKEAAWGLPLLLRLVEPREDAVERVMDSGYMYIRSRELYGNLVYAKQRVRDAFSLVQAILEANLTVKHLRVHGPRAYQLAVRAAPPVKAALHGLFADAPVPAGREVQHTKLCEALGAALLTRYTNQGAKQHCVLWQQLLATAKKGVAIRTKLKVHAEAAVKEDLKQKAGEVPVVFDPDKCLGKLDAGTLHALLRFVVGHAPKQLAKANLKQIVALMAAYGDTTRKNAKTADRPEVLAELGELIKSKDGFVAYDCATFAAPGASAGATHKGKAASGVDCAAVPVDVCAPAAATPTAATVP